METEKQFSGIKSKAYPKVTRSKSSTVAQIDKLYLQKSGRQRLKSDNGMVMIVNIEISQRPN